PPTPGSANGATSCRIQAGSGTQSASVKAISSPVAAMTPRFRAAYELATPVSSTSRTGYSPTIARVASVDRLSTTTTSSARAGHSRRPRASRQVRIVAAPSRTGTTTLTRGTASGTRALRGLAPVPGAEEVARPLLPARQHATVAAVALVLDREHPLVARRPERRDELVEPVVGARRHRLHPVLVPRPLHHPLQTPRPADR